jgi:hypothetical protein
MRAFIVAAAILAMAFPAAALEGGGGKKPAPKPASMKSKEMEAKIEEILDSFQGEKTYSSDNERVKKLIRMGHDAVAPLIGQLRKRHHVDRGHGFSELAATDALAGLLEPDDVPAVALLLEEGMTEAAPALRNLKKDLVREALLAPLRKGWCSYKLVEELERFRTDPAVRREMLAYLEKYGRSGDYVTGQVAEWLGEAGVKEALPQLKKILDAGEGNMSGRHLVAAAIVALGDKAGIPGLLDVFTSGGSRGNDYERHTAGEVLNRILRERVYVGSFDPGEERKGNFDEAAKRFAEWWEKAKASIRFDEKTYRWVWD